MATFYKAPSVDFWSTTLNGSIDSSVQTITLNSTTGLQFPGVVVIDRQDGNGTATPSSREVVSFTGISGSNLTGCTRAFAGSTARSHSSAALVESAPEIQMWNDLRDAVAASLTTDGTGIALSGTASIATLNLTNALTIPALTLTSAMSVAKANVLNSYLSNVTVTGGFNVSGASVVGINTGLNILFQVPGSLASQANIGGLIPVPGSYTAQFMEAFVQTPASVASIGIFVLKNSAVVGTVHIAGGATFASSASFSATGLVAGDVLTLDIRSNASLATDLSLLVRAS